MNDPMKPGQVLPRRRDFRSLERSARPRLEPLEDRQLLSSLDGGQWVHPNLITYSFMPDGTSIGGIPSNLFRTLNAVAPTAAWEQAFEKAAAVWQQVANINLTLVPDDGAPVGTSGNQQGDPRFGDIRIGAYPQNTSGQLAIDFLPAPVNGGTDAGDLFLNSNVSWQVNGNYDIETVAIHELGHALGLGHSSIQSADMYAQYYSQRQGLTSDDMSGVQGIYGPVPASATGNHSFATATDITPYLNAQGQGAGAGVSIVSSGDYDYYKVTAPSTTNGTLTVTMQSSDLSSLSPRLAVFAGNQSSLGQSVAANVYGATVSYTVNGVAPGQVYYIRCSSANSGPGSNGAYGLEVNFGPDALGPIAPPNTAVASQPDKGGGTAAQVASQPTLGLGLGSLLNVGLTLGSGLGVSASIGPIDIGLQIQVGTLSVWADPLMARGPVHHTGHHHPNGPLGNHSIPRPFRGLLGPG